jgi:hypothetical protein
MKVFREIKYRKLLLLPPMIGAILSATLIAIFRLNGLVVPYIAFCAWLLLGALFLMVIDSKYK